MNAHDVMASPVVTVKPYSSVREVAQLLLSRRISAVPVVDDQGMLVGIVSDVMNHRFLAEGLTAAAAKSQGLRWALIIMVCINVWSFVHYMIAARTLERDSAPDRT